jgi:hypothetical protein
MFDAILIVLTLLSKPDETCNATRFGYPGDKWAGGAAVYLKRPVAGHDVGVAHRSLPLGSRVLVHNLESGRFAVGLVIDRGPYGAIDEDGEWALKLKKSDPGKWRGCLDLTPSLADKLEHDGYGRVRVWAL